ncbi:MAG: class I fructose-bisphosphate aldolase [Candidatus Saccharimonadaceae bacterium]
MAFSYARVIQQLALDILNGKDENVSKANESLLYRANCNPAARRSERNCSLRFLLKKIKKTENIYLQSCLRKIQIPQI